MKGPAMRRARNAHKSESTFQQTELSLNPPEVVSVAAAAAAAATILLPLVFLHPSIREEQTGNEQTGNSWRAPGPNRRRARARARDEAPLIAAQLTHPKGRNTHRRILLVWTA